MVQIKQMEEYKALLRENKQRLGVTDSNCMLMTSDMMYYIEEGRLYAESDENGLYVFIDEGVRLNCCYFRRPGAPLPGLRQDKSVLIEEMDNRGARSAYLDAFEPLLLEGGFVLSRRNLQVERMNGAKPDGCAELRQRLCADGFTLERLDEGSVPEDVAALWAAHLDPLDIPQDHMELHQGESILNIRCGKTLAATVWWKHGGRTSECRHIVTNPAYQRRGLAGALLCLWFEDAARCGATRLLTWINEENAASLALFGGFGFERNGRVSRQYLLKK